MMFFAATYKHDVMEFAEAIVNNPIAITLKREEESLDNIKQYYVKCRNKFLAISNIYGVVTIGQAIIFCHVSFVHALSNISAPPCTYLSFLFIFRLGKLPNGLFRK